jgi:hypothetical protein
MEDDDEITGERLSVPVPGIFSIPSQTLIRPSDIIRYQSCFNLSFKISSYYVILQTLSMVGHIPLANSLTNHAHHLSRHIRVGFQPE